MYPTRLTQQRGVISVLAALTIGTVLLIAALAVDLGHLFWVKRDLQKTADLASLSALTNLGSATTIAQQIAKDNNFDSTVTGNSLTAVTGVYNWTNRTFIAGGAAASQNAVEVTVATPVPYFFLAGTRSVQATAIAARNAFAGFSAGAFLARLNTSTSPLLNGVLGGLLGSAVNLSVLDYQGIAAGSVSLGDLQAALGFGSVDELLNANVSLADLLAASATALGNKGDAASINAANILGGLTVSRPSSLRLGDLFKVDTSTPQAAANAEVNLMQMLLLGAEIANGSQAIDLHLAVPPLASAKLNVIQPPSIAIGPAQCIAGTSCNPGTISDWVTRAHSAQASLELKVNLLLTSVTIVVEAAAMDAALTGIQCRSPIQDSTVTIHAQPQLLTARIGGAIVAQSAGGTAREVTFDGPFDLNNTQTVSGGGLSGLLGSIPLLGAVMGALGAVLDGLVDPLLSMLGVSLGGGDITAFYLSCGVPQLVK